MSTFDLENPDPNPGDGLRDEAANLLAYKYGRPEREHRVHGKKVDLHFKRREFGKESSVFVEAKDLDHSLKRSEVIAIWADYQGIVEKHQPSILLLVTRQGLTSDAQAYVNQENPMMRHQTIWELENEVVGLTEYIRHLAELFDEDGLSSYYVPGFAREAIYMSSEEKRKLTDEALPIFDVIQEWLRADDTRPIAVLGGYGAGKTSLARRLVSDQARKALADPLARRPILVRLGDMSRYSSLQGLLGGMFTHDFPISGFNARYFLDLNAKGRMLIVLDGFDEMKHAMTWADFRHTIAEFNRLVVGRGKVVLLGRPSAFTSTDEHFHVLRGIKRHGDGWRRLPEWPDFHEYELREFTPSERAEFVRGYLRALSPSEKDGSVDEARIDERANEVNRLADKDPDVFGKPVHAKILSDLAADLSVDLRRFSDGVSRWQLYEIFFSSLAERETEKAARRPIGESDRLQFLREVAFWLWSAKGGITSFSSDDIPDDMLEALPLGDAADTDAQKREYLAGSFLEKKTGDLYYFGHRSFAEFLVADRMVRVSPAPGDHGVYSRLAQDGVLSFLQEAPNKDGIKTWADSFDAAQGNIRLEYIAFLAEIAGGLGQFLDALPSESHWKQVLAVFRDEMMLSTEVEKRIYAAMRNQNNVTFSLLLSILQLRPVAANTLQWHNRMSEIAAALLERVFNSVKTVEDSGKAKIPESAVEARNLAHKVLPEVSDERYDQMIAVHWGRLLQAKKDCLREAGVDVILDKRLPEPLPSTETAIPLFDVLFKMKDDNRRKAETYFRRARSLAGVFCASHKVTIRRSN